MLNAEQSIVNEVEQAISLGSAEKSLETVRRVTSLFLASAGNFNSEQIELFDHVLERLIKTIEIRAIADISARVALVETSLQLAGGCPGASHCHPPSGTARLDHGCRPGVE